MNDEDLKHLDKILFGILAVCLFILMIGVGVLVSLLIALWRFG